MLRSRSLPRISVAAPLASMSASDLVTKEVEIVVCVGTRNIHIRISDLHSGRF